jgi:maleate isomerase
MRVYRVGLIVPSSNTTMETEIPLMLHGREQRLPEKFTFHSSRMRMKHVTPEELRAMDEQSLRSAAELADARIDALAYACLVAIMAQGTGYHSVSQDSISRVVRESTGMQVPVVTSAGALIEALRHVGAKRASVITPYMKPLTKLVCDYIAAAGIEIHDALSLEVADNLAVGRLPQERLTELAREVDTRGVDALVLSACVQMPSLQAVAAVQRQFDVPVLSAATATVWRLLGSLGLEQTAPDAGWLLDGRYGKSADVPVSGARPGEHGGSTSRREG